MKRPFFSGIELTVIAVTLIGAAPFGIAAVGQHAIRHPRTGKALRLLRWGLLLAGGYAFLVVAGIIPR